MTVENTANIADSITHEDDDMEWDTPSEEKASHTNDTNNSRQVFTNHMMPILRHGYILRMTTLLSVWRNMLTQP